VFQQLLYTEILKSSWSLGHKKEMKRPGQVPGCRLPGCLSGWLV